MPPRTITAILNYFDAVVDDTGMLKAELGDDGLHPNALAATL
ncbi:MAG: hypothetical protein WKF84_00305 [Pyrinomonadaceae bacterium]